MNAQRYLEHRLTSVGVLNGCWNGVLWIDADVLEVRASERGVRVSMAADSLDSDKYKALRGWNDVEISSRADLDRLAMEAYQVFCP